MHEIAFTIVGRFILKPLSMEHRFNGGRSSGLMLLSKPLHGEGERGGSPLFRQSGQSCLSCVFYYFSSERGGQAQRAILDK